MDKLTSFFNELEKLNDPSLDMNYIAWVKFYENNAIQWYKNRLHRGLYLTNALQHIKDVEHIDWKAYFTNKYRIVDDQGQFKSIDGEHRVEDVYLKPCTVMWEHQNSIDLLDQSTRESINKYFKRNNMDIQKPWVMMHLAGAVKCSELIEKTQDLDLKNHWQEQFSKSFEQFYSAKATWN